MSATDAMRIAVVGASGFIGRRTVEMFHLLGWGDVRPVVRTTSGVASLSRFRLECALADARDRGALRQALAGCDAVVHAVAGDSAAILESAEAVYRAAEDVGARRMVYLSSGAVHGQSPVGGTDERSELETGQPIRYNNAKVRAERRLHALRRQGAVELVVLRPGIVTGPRSQWITGFADALLSNEAGLVDGGRGICNALYVDNLVHGIRLALTSPTADRHAFLLSDDERQTWADVYEPIARALGFDLADLPEARPETLDPRWVAHLHGLRESPAGRLAGRIAPAWLRRGVKAALRTPSDQADLWTEPVRRGPVISLEMDLLYRCQWRLPDDKARRLLEYRAVVQQSVAIERTLGWLRFAGYPVRVQAARLASVTQARQQ